jgi:hypothetical protein
MEYKLQKYKFGELYSIKRFELPGAFYMRRCLLKFLLFSFVAIAPQMVSASQSAIEGSMEWRYGAHEAEEEGEQVFDADWLTQQYTLVYQYQGLLAKGRAGKYDLSLGYEWNALDGDLNGESTDVTSAKILYEGDVVFAPAGLPLHLNAYSRDLSQSHFSTTAARGLFEGLPSDGYVAPEVVTGLYNGQNIQSGLTLSLGSSSGDYSGPYRDIMANAPRLLFDYRQNYVKDLKGLTPQHYRDRNLAFVSLNKKDNWFHYRVYDHKNFLAPGEDFVEKEYILGTIDQSLQRKWVRLTNWIEVSMDASYTTTNINVGGGEPERRYDFNFFTVARRQGWEAANFSTYMRERGPKGIEKEVEIPVYASKALNPETDLRMRFVAARDDDQWFDVDREGQIRENLYLSTRLDAFQKQPWRLSHQLDVEKKGGTEGEGGAVRALVELSSNRLFRPKYDFFSSYALAYFRGEGKAGFDTDFLEQSLIADIQTDLTPGVRIGARQEFVYGSGELERSITDYIDPESSRGMLFSRDEEGGRREGDVFRSTSTWFSEFRGHGRFTSRIELTYDYFSEGGSADDTFMATHRLRYDSQKFYATMENRLIWGEQELGTNSISSSSLTEGISGEVDASIENRLYLACYPWRSVETSLRADHNWRKLENGNANQYFVEQLAVYSFFENGGFGRKIFALAEEFEWERFSSPEDVVRSARTLTLSGELYPTIRTLLGVRLRYRYLEPEDTTTYTGYLTAGINWEKLQISVDYAYGTRGEGETDPERVEHRWEVKARKIF